MPDAKKSTGPTMTTSAANLSDSTAHSLMPPTKSPSCPYSVLEQDSTRRNSLGSPGSPTRYPMPPTSLPTVPSHYAGAVGCNRSNRNIYVATMPKSPNSCAHEPTSSSSPARRLQHAALGRARCRGRGTTRRPRLWSRQLVHEIFSYEYQASMDQSPHSFYQVITHYDVVVGF